jgi:hypothetical protein
MMMKLIWCYYCDGRLVYIYYVVPSEMRIKC